MPAVAMLVAHSVRRDDDLAHGGGSRRGSGDTCTVVIQCANCVVDRCARDSVHDLSLIATGEEDCSGTLKNMVGLGTKRSGSGRDIEVLDACNAHCAKNILINQPVLFWDTAGYS